MHLVQSVQAYLTCPLCNLFPRRVLSRMNMMIIFTRKDIVGSGKHHASPPLILPTENNQHPKNCDKMFRN